METIVCDMVELCLGRDGAWLSIVCSFAVIAVKKASWHARKTRAY